jgi:hypothetical protein
MTTAAPRLATNSSSAVPVTVNDVPVVGGPTTSPIARGNVEGTSIDATNNSLTHSCDFVNDLKKSIGLKKFLKAIMRWVREGIRAIQRFLGLSDPSGSFSQLINMLKSFAEYVRYIQKEYIEPINDFLKYVLAVITKIRAIIQWILSLPAKLLALLKECLMKLLTTLANIFADAWAESKLDVPSQDVGKGFSELASAVKDAGSAVSDLLKESLKSVSLVAGIGTSATVGLLVPVSQDQMNEANKIIKDYTGNLPAGLQTPDEIKQNKTNPV